MAFTADSVSILNGQDVVDVNSAESIENIKAGDFLQIGSFPLVEIKQAYKNGQGQKFIQLIKAWELTTQNNQPAIVIPTSGEFRAAVKALQDANILVNDNQQALQDYQNNLGTVTFKKSDGTTTTVKTLKQIEADNQAQMNAYHPYPWAMRKVEFEAMRAANEEKYAASGWVNKGKNAAAGANNAAVGDGLDSVIVSTFANSLRLGRSVDAVGSSKTDYPVLHIAGVVTDVLQVSIINSDSAHSQIKLPPAEDGTRTYDSATGESVTHATPALAFAAETATNKVVTDRVDMWGFEAFLREINDNDPFVYKNGLIQSLASDINGVVTVSDNVRPITYFAWFEDDTTSRGKGVNWQTATEAQRIAIASDRGNENRIYFDDSTGKFYQWCIRGRSFAGVGNGDWQYVDSTGFNYLRFTEKYVVNPIGSSDTALVNGAANSNSYRATNRVANTIGVEGVFNAGDVYQESVAVNGECYFLVCDTIERLNKGAYHPSFNSLGTAKLRLNTGVGGAKLWHESGAKSPSNKADCFSFGDDLTVGDVAPFIGNNWGSLVAGTTLIGRPDGRYYDAIYESGQGGVCRDMRYSAHKLTAEDFAKEDLKIKSGEYRGFERMTFTKITYNLDGENSQGAGVSPVGGTSEFSVGDVVFVQGIDGQYRKRVISSVSQATVLFTETVSRAENGLIVHIRKSATSLASEYTHTEVIGDPAYILLCDDLKDGWVGSWNPTIPDGTRGWGEFMATKPLSDALVKKSQSNDNGVNWSSSTSTFSLVKNGPTESSIPSSTLVTIWNYKTKATSTISTTNSEVYGAKSDLGDVLFSQSCNEWGAKQLGYSLTGGILTSIGSGTSKFFQTVKLESYSLYEGKLGAWTSTNRGSPTHALPKDFNAPENEGPAFKALNYNVAKNQQGFINYAYAQLTYDATAGDWGDDGKIHIADNQTTMPDENGHINLVGMAQCVEPIGWLKNDK